MGQPEAEHVRWPNGIAELLWPVPPVRDLDGLQELRILRRKEFQAVSARGVQAGQRGSRVREGNAMTIDHDRKPILSSVRPIDNIAIRHDACPQGGGQLNADVSNWNKYVSRVELSLPVKPTSPADVQRSCCVDRSHERRTGQGPPDRRHRRWLPVRRCAVSKCRPAAAHAGAGNLGPEPGQATDPGQHATIDFGERCLGFPLWPRIPRDTRPGQLRDRSDSTSGSSCIRHRRHHRRGRLLCGCRFQEPQAPGNRMARM